MKLKAKQITIITISAILLIFSLGAAYLFASGAIEYETIEIEGVPTIPLTAQIVILCILAVINLVNILLCKNLIKHKVILIVLNFIQLFFGGVIQIVGSIVMIVLLFINTTDIQEEKKKLELPQLEKIEAKRKWIYFIIFFTIFTVFYSGLVPMPFLENIPPIARIAFIYIAQAIILILALKKDIKRDFTAFKKNFKTYIKYLFPKLGIFLMAYIVVTVPISLILGQISTNQQQINELPLVLTIIMAVFIAPFIEEFMFRGLLRKSFKNDILFIIFSSLTFGAAHVLFAEENLMMYLYIIPYSLIGYFLSRTYSKTNNIFTNITVHFLWNAFCMALTTIMSLIGQ